MQSYGPRALLLDFRFLAVFPGTTSNHHGQRRTRRRYVAYGFSMLLAFALCAGRAQGLSQRTLMFGPSSGSFGSVAVGSSKTISLTIQNNGTAPAVISADTVHATGFSVSGLTIPHTISVGGFIPISLKFAPASTGLSSGYVLFTSNATNSSVEYAVSGTGVSSSAGAVTTTPSTVSFGTVADGTTNSQTVQLKNTGSSSVTISSATV